MSRGKVVTIAMGLFMVLSATPAVVAEGPDEAGASGSDGPARLIVGFTSLPRGLGKGDDYLGATIVRTDAGLHFAVVEAPSHAAFEARVRNEPSFSYVDVDRFTTWISFTPNDPRYSDQYGPQNMQVPAVWDTWRGSTAKTVCVVDTGVRGDHEEFAGRYLGGYDYVNEDSTPNDDHGHGTHVAGTVAAGIHNAVGVAGMANVNIRAVKVLNSAGQGYDSDVASGIRHCADNADGVISLSLGSSGGSTTLSNAVNYAWDQGSLIVAASGNDGCTPCVYYPAAYANAIAVGCTTSSNAQCWFSNGGSQLDLVAPGEDILSTLYSSTNAYGYKSGTSMSTPHVSGVAALIWSKQPALTNAQVREALEETATDLGASGWDAEFGHGIVNAQIAFEAAYPDIPLVNVIEETFDDGVADGFTLTGLWHVSSTCATPHSPTQQLAYNKDATCTYQTTDSFGLSNANSGTATKSYDLSSALQANITFWHKFEHESASIEVDTKRIQVSADGSTWTTLALWDARTANQDWNEVDFPINSFVGGTVYVRFAFDTVDGASNNYAGWFIDNARVRYGDNYPPNARAGADLSLYDADGNGAVTFALDGRNSTDSDGTIASTRWMENGVEIASGPQASASFSVGLHTVVLNVTDNDGASAEDILIVDARANRAPTARAPVDSSASDGDGTGAESVTLADAGSSDPDATTLTHSWFEGSTLLGTGASISPSLAVGLHTIRLQVTDIGGASGNDTVVIDILPNRAPIASFGHSCVGLTCTFNASTSSDPDGLALASWAWDFADAGTRAGQVVNVTFSNFAARTVSLSVTDGGGLVSNISRSVTVGASMHFQTGFDNGLPGGMTLTGLWHISSSCVPTFTAPSHLAYRRTTVCDFNTGVANAGTMKFPVDLRSMQDARVTFYQIAEAGACSGTVSWDRRIVDVYTAGGTYLGRPFIQDCKSPQTLTWTEVNVNLTPYAGQLVEIHFAFDSSTSSNNNKLGWALDDIIVSSGQQLPVARAGPDVTLRDSDGTGAEATTLDGSGSSAGNGIATYTWSEDAQTLGESVTLFQGFSVGQHLVNLTIVDTIGMGATDSLVITVLANVPPTAVLPSTINVGDLDGDGAQAVDVSGMASSDPDGVILAYTWELDGVQVATGAQPSISAALGDHTLTLRVRDNGNAESSATATLRVLANRAPTARAPLDIAARDSDGDGAETIALADGGSSDPDGGALSYAWYDDTTFLGAGSSLAASLAIGIHSIRLHVTDLGGLSNNDTLLIDVLPNRAPTAAAPANITLRDRDGTSAELASLVDAGSSDPDGTALTFAWYEGAALLGTGSSYSHEFSVGVHTVRLTVTDVGGAQGDATFTVTVHANRIPIVLASADASKIDTNGDNVESFTLTDQGSFDPDGTAITHQWIEGADVLGAGTTLTRDFTVGVHDVILRVTDVGGGIGEEPVVITVIANQPPTARASSTCLDLHCWFNASASSDPEGPVTITWAFGDGTTSNAFSIEHVYPDNGAFAWTLTALDTGGLTNTLPGTATVAREPPRAAPLVAPARPQVPDQTSTEPADRLPLLDVDAAWFEADYNFLYVGLQARPGVSPVGVNYSVSFGPGWIPVDPTWNGSIGVGQSISTLTARASFDPDPIFTLSGMAGSTEVDLGAVNGSWDSARGIAWWQLPVDRLEGPGLGVATIATPRAASSILPVMLPLSGVPAGDTTGSAPSWRMVYTQRILESVQTFDFEEDADGFRKESEQVFSEVNWDPVRGAILIVENKADLRDEVYSRGIGTLTPAQSFQLTARFEVSSRGNAQPSTPLFLGGASVTYPHLDGNVARIGYRDVVVGAGTYTFQVRDAAGLSRMSISVAGPERAHLSIAYDAPTRTFTMSVMQLDGTTVATGSGVLPAGSTFSFAKLGASSDGAPLAQHAAPMVAHVDDFALRLR